MKSIPTDRKTLTRLFAKRNIPTEEIAFYNDPHFGAAEQKDPTFLELYAAWVRLRPRDASYDRHVRRTIHRTIEVLAPEIARDPQKGVCIDASLMLAKMLELEGIWCYVARGALTIESSTLGSPTHFWAYDDEQVAGHAWVVAPPFEIIDVALGNQLFTHGEDRLVPQSIVVEQPLRVAPAATDYFSTNVLQRAYLEYGPLPKDIHLRIQPHLARIIEFFPSFEVPLERAKLRYAAAGVTMSDGKSVYTITSRRWNGKFPGELYDDIVRPALATSDETDR